MQSTNINLTTYPHGANTFAGELRLHDSGGFLFRGGLIFNLITHLKKLINARLDQTSS